MALGFQASGFQSPGFQQLAGGARPTGGGYDQSGWNELFLRIGREKVDRDDEEEIIEAVAEKIVDGGSVEVDDGELVFPEMVTIDWDAVARLREQSERLKQGVVLEVIARVVEAVRRAEDDDDDRAAEFLLLN